MKNEIFETKNVRKNRLKAERRAEFMKKEHEQAEYREGHPTLEDRVDRIERWIGTQDEGFFDDIPER